MNAQNDFQDQIVPGSVEVIISDQLPDLGSQFGHLAIGIDGTIYSRTHNKYAVLAHGAYIHIQRGLRNSVVTGRETKNRNKIKETCRNKRAV
ncbi:MAG: hypothetical protein LBU45_07325 [Azoarcus sp.]|jgi:hypothetical protein|nr:hypothetical protein [Azoarcus sp.]